MPWASTIARNQGSATAQQHQRLPSATSSQRSPNQPRASAAAVRRVTSGRPDDQRRQGQGDRALGQHAAAGRRPSRAIEPPAARSTARRGGAPWRRPRPAPFSASSSAHVASVMKKASGRSGSDDVRDREIAEARRDDRAADQPGARVDPAPPARRRSSARCRARRGPTGSARRSRRCRPPGRPAPPASRRRSASGSGIRSCSGE